MNLLIPSTYFPIHPNFKFSKPITTKDLADNLDALFFSRTIDTLEHLNRTGAHSSRQFRIIKDLLKDHPSASKEVGDLLNRVQYLPHKNKLKWARKQRNCLHDLNINQNHWICLSGSTEHAVQLRIQRVSHRYYKFYLTNTGAGSNSSIFHPKYTKSNGRDLIQTTAVLRVEKSYITASLFQKINQILNQNKKTKEAICGKDYTLNAYQKLYNKLLDIGRIERKTFSSHPKLYSGPQFGDSCSALSIWKALRPLLRNKSYQELRLMKKISDLFSLKAITHLKNGPLSQVFILNCIASKITHTLSKYYLLNNKTEMTSLIHPIEEIYNLQLTPDSTALFTCLPSSIKPIIYDPQSSDLNSPLYIYKATPYSVPNSLNYRLEFLKISNSPSLCTYLNYALYKLYFYAAEGNQIYFSIVLNSNVIQSFLADRQKSYSKYIDPLILTLFCQLPSQLIEEGRTRNHYALAYALILLVDYTNSTFSKTPLNSSSILRHIQKLRSKYYTINAPKYLGKTHPLINNVNQLEQVHYEIRNIS